MPTDKRYAIITPYHKEDRRLIERAVNSVKAQTVPTDHFLVADGFPQAWVDDSGVRHLKLDREHGYGGNTPRGVGTLVAIGEEYDGIGMLDADNWLDNDHVQTCIEAAESAEGGMMLCDYVIAQWRLRRLDESIMPWPEDLSHVDTNRFFFLRGAFSVIPHWAMQPPQLAPVCDQIFYSFLKELNLQFVRAKRPTVNYQNLFEVFYRALGEAPPENAKPNPDGQIVNKYLSTLNARQLQILNRLTGLKFAVEPPETAKVQAPVTHPRNSKCPCGSGKKFKHCHGRFV
jgi:hypothetical protein